MAYFEREARLSYWVSLYPHLEEEIEEAYIDESFKWIYHGYSKKSFCALFRRRMIRLIN